MVFERIGLLNIYDALVQIETNEGPITSILINRTTRGEGTKKLPRFSSILEFKSFIQNNYPYVKVKNPECECYTCNEGFIHLLSISIEDGDDSIFVNNMREVTESQKEAKLNTTSTKTLNNLIKQQQDIFKLFIKFDCFGYIDPQAQYWNPCEFAEFRTNHVYVVTIENYYKKTKRADFPQIKKNNC